MRRQGKTSAVLAMTAAILGFAILAGCSRSGEEEAKRPGTAGREMTSQQAPAKEEALAPKPGPEPASAPAPAPAPAAGEVEKKAEPNFGC